MIGGSIHSDNHMRKRKSQGNQSLLQLRQFQKLMQSWKRKVKGTKQVRLPMKNIQQVTLNDTTQMVNSCRSIGAKIVLPKMTWPAGL